MNKRQYLTKREKLGILDSQAWYCICGCRRQIWPVHRVEWEHTLPIGLCGQGKPDAAMLYLCHKIKTREDRQRMAKADRQRKAFQGTKIRKDRKLQSRGFQGWKNFKGEAVFR